MVEGDELDKQIDRIIRGDKKDIKDIYSQLNTMIKRIDKIIILLEKIEGKDRVKIDKQDALYNAQ